MDCGTTQAMSSRTDTPLTRHSESARRLCTLSLLVSAVALTGCPADPAVWGDAQWQVRCPDGFSGCSRAGDRVDIFNFDGVDGITADCSVRRSGDERVVDLTVGKGSQRLAITSLLTGATGGAVRAGCFATIIDDANTYGGRTFGTCGGGVPGEGAALPDQQLDHRSRRPRRADRCNGYSMSQPPCPPRNQRGSSAMWSARTTKRVRLGFECSIVQASANSASAELAPANDRSDALTRRATTSASSEPALSGAGRSDPAATLPRSRTDDALTDDALTGRMRVWQRQRGHRYSLDDVLTAFEAAQRAESLEPAASYLDLGCGIGSVLLMVMDCQPTLRASGVEAQSESIALCRRNIERNRIAATLVHGDLRDPVTHQQLPAPFDLISGTPPYKRLGTATPSPDPQRAHARMEFRGGIEDYLRAAASLIKPAGQVVICGDSSERARVGAQRAGLFMVREVRAIPRAGREPLFFVWSFQRTKAEVVFDNFVARNADGTRTTQYRELRAFFGLLPSELGATS